MNEASPLVFTLETVAGPANFNWRVEQVDEEIEVSVDLAGGTPLSTRLSEASPQGAIHGTLAGGGLEGQVTLASLERVTFSGVTAVRLDAILVAQGVSMAAHNLPLGLFSDPEDVAEQVFPPPFTLSRIDLQGAGAIGTFTWQAMRTSNGFQVLLGHSLFDGQVVMARPGGSAPVRVDFPGFPPKKVPPGGVRGMLSVASLPAHRDLVRFSGELRAGAGDDAVRGRFRGPVVLVPPPVIP